MGGWQWVMVRRQTTTCLILLILAVAKINAELDFAVHVKEGGEEAAERIARKHGMQNMGEVRALKNYLDLSIHIFSSSNMLLWFDEKDG